MGTESSHQQVRAAGQWDGLVTQMQTWRRVAGEPSYSDISQRISEQRQRGGLPEAAARVGRSTVYDAFRLGRARLNLDLVREICAALGVDDDEIETAIHQSLTAPSVPTPRPAEHLEPEPNGVLEAPTAAAVMDESLDEGQHAVAVPPAAPPEALSSAPSPTSPPNLTSATPPTPSATPSPTTPSAAEVQAAPIAAAATPAAPSVGQVALLLVCCVIINLLGRAVVDLFHLPLYLDMVGTAVAAIALGPWRGAAVGVATGALGAITVGWVSFAFTPVAIVGALAWGYGVRRFGMGRTIARFFGLATLTSVLCTLVAAPILLLVFGGSVGHDQDNVARAAGAFFQAWAMKVSLANLLTSFFDKVISSFIALVWISLLPASLRPRSGDLVVMTGLPQTAGSQN